MQAHAVPPNAPPRKLVGTLCINGGLSPVKIGRSPIFYLCFFLRQCRRKLPFVFHHLIGGEKLLLIFAKGENLPCFLPKGENPLSESTVIIEEKFDKFSVLCCYLSLFLSDLLVFFGIVATPIFFSKHWLVMPPEVKNHHNSATLSSYFLSLRSEKPNKNRT